MNIKTFRKEWRSKKGVCVWCGKIWREVCREGNKRDNIKNCKNNTSFYFMGIICKVYYPEKTIQKKRKRKRKLSRRTIRLLERWSEQNSWMNYSRAGQAPPIPCAPVQSKVWVPPKFITTRECPSECPQLQHQALWLERGGALFFQVKCRPRQYTCWSPIPQYLRVTIFGDKVF